MANESTIQSRGRRVRYIHALTGRWATPVGIAVAKQIVRTVLDAEAGGLPHRYRIVVAPGCCAGFRGKGTRAGCRVFINDANIRMVIRQSESRSMEIGDFRYAWHPKRVLRSSAELLAYGLGHEIHHATAGNPTRFRYWDRSGKRKTNRASMEFQCNLAAWEAVMAWRVHRGRSLVTVAHRALAARRRAACRVAAATSVNHKNARPVAISQPKRRGRAQGTET